MTVTEPQRTPLDATDALAQGVSRALADPRHAFQLSDHVLDTADLAAVRVLNTDVLTPYLLHGRQLNPDDAGIVAEAVRVYPPPEPAEQSSALLWCARDWALGVVLDLLGAPVPPGLPAGPPPADRFDGQPWPVYTALMAQLASLALPQLAGPARQLARARRADVLSGMVRAMLRRDPSTAAKLARWLALDAATAPEPLLAPALAHLEFFATGQPRVRLELTLAGLLTATTPEQRS